MKDLRLVEYAVALGRHRNFARAAESLRVTQPSFSRGIAALEKSLGTRLFERSTRRVEPTSTGIAFLERAERLLEDAARLGELTRDRGDSLSGQLTVGSGPYPLDVCVLPAVARLVALHPRLRISVIEGRWRELAGELMLGAIDLAVLHASIFANDYRVEVEMLPQREGVMVCRAEHPLTRLRRVTTEHIQPYPLIGIPMVSDMLLKMGATTNKFMVDHLSGDVVPPISTTSLHSMRELLLRTEGLGLCLPSQVRADVEANRLTVLKLDFGLPSTGYGIVRLRGRSLSRAALAFIHAVRDIEAELDQSAGVVPATRPVRWRQDTRR
jgi:DNA-binding transcriptional LysR family regulator